MSTTVVMPRSTIDIEAIIYQESKRVTVTSCYYKLIWTASTGAGSYRYYRSFRYHSLSAVGNSNRYGKC